MKTEKKFIEYFEAGAAYRRYRGLSGIAARIAAVMKSKPCSLTDAVAITLSLFSGGESAGMRQQD